MTSFKSYSSSSSKPTARTHSGNRSRSRPGYALGTLNPVTHREESSSTEEFGFGPTTKIEGKAAGGSSTGSQEDLEPHGNGVGDGAVKVTTDVHVHVEERV